MTTDWLSTVRQTLPHLFEVWGHAQPTFELASAATITPDFLRHHDLDAVLWDIDGTLMAYHATDIDPVYHATVRAMFADGPARHAIVSNCDERRFVELGTIFPEVPVIRAYATPTGPVFRHVVGGRDTHEPENVRALLEGGGRQIRKPSGVLIEHALAVLEIADPARAIMVGDQYFTDVASANLAGARSGKVPTFARPTFPVSIRITQRLERLMYRMRFGAPSAPLV